MPGKEKNECQFSRAENNRDIKGLKEKEQQTAWVEKIVGVRAESRDEGKTRNRVVEAGGQTGADGSLPPQSHPCPGQSTLVLGRGVTGLGGNEV